MYIECKLLKSINNTMSKEIFSIAAVFWILIPIGLVGGALLLKFQGDWFSRNHHKLSYCLQVK